MGKSVVLSLCLLLIASTSALCFDDVSFRMRAVGEELRWIVDDEYTDILINPASLALLSEKWVITNLSNLTDTKHQFLDYGQNYYSANGALLLGTFQTTRHGNFGVIADYWKSKRWTTTGPGMSLEFRNSYEFGWPIHYDEVGTRTDVIYDGTPDGDDDYQTALTVDGMEYLHDEQALNLTFIFGRGDFGGAYTLTYDNRHVPYDPYPMLESAYNYYELIELDEIPTKEAVEAEQLEVRNIDNRTANNRFSVGYSKEVGQGSALEVIGAIIYSTSTNSEETTRQKRIDYDPDNDGESHSGSKDYRQYAYDETEERSGDMSGLGFDLLGRYSRQAGPQARLRFVGDVYYLPEESDDYFVTRTVEEVMTTFSPRSGFENKYTAVQSGSKKMSMFRTRLGLGAEIRPIPHLVVGVAAKWLYVHSELATDLSGGGDDVPRRDSFDDKRNHHTFIIPIGIEYNLDGNYAFRLGVASSFQTWEYATYTYTEYVSHWNSDVIEDLETSMSGTDNKTSYSYGFGWKINKNFHLDIAGVTNLLEVNDFLLSLIVKY